MEYYTSGQTTSSSSGHKSSKDNKDRKHGSGGHKKKPSSKEYKWTCCQCKWEGLDYTLDQYCTMCGYQRCGNCRVDAIKHKSSY